MSEAGLLADPAEVRAILVASAKAGEAITSSETLSLLEVRVHPDDLGKVIGRNGRTATAFRTVISALGGRSGPRIVFVDVDKGR